MKEENNIEETEEHTKQKLLCHVKRMDANTLLAIPLHYTLPVGDDKQTKAQMKESWKRGTGLMY